MPKSTKRVRFLRDIASGTWYHETGEVADVDAVLADAWIRAETCEPAARAALGRPEVENAPWLGRP